MVNHEKDQIRDGVEDPKYIKNSIIVDVVEKERSQVEFSDMKNVKPVELKKKINLLDGLWKKDKSLNKDILSAIKDEVKNDRLIGISKEYKGEVKIKQDDKIYFIHPDESKLK